MKKILSASRENKTEHQQKNKNQMTISTVDARRQNKDLKILREKDDQLLYTQQRVYKTI